VVFESLVFLTPRIIQFDSAKPHYNAATLHHLRKDSNSGTQGIVNK
jgi:hypothetical protein